MIKNQVLVDKGFTLSYLSEEKKLIESYKERELRDDSYRMLINTIINKNGFFRVSKHVVSKSLVELQFENAICYEISLVAIDHDEVQVWLNLIQRFSDGKNSVKSFDLFTKDQAAISELNRDGVEEQFNNGLNHEFNVMLISNSNDCDKIKMNSIRVYERLIKVNEKDIVFCFSNDAATLYFITFDVSYNDLIYFSSKLPRNIISYQLFIENDDWVYVTAEVE